jgi:hypothetical protein
MQMSWARSPDPCPNESSGPASTDLVNPDLNNLINTLPPTSRYSFVFDGTPQAIDHTLVTQNLLPRVSRFSTSGLTQILRRYSATPWIVQSEFRSRSRAGLHSHWDVAEDRKFNSHASEVVVEGEGSPERQYHIERSSDLITWQQIGSAVPDGTQRFSFRDLNPVSGAAFYRPALGGSKLSRFLLLQPRTSNSRWKIISFGRNA